MMSVLPSAASINAPDEITKSPALVVLILPSVMLPSAVKLIKPVPALISVSPVICNTSLPATMVMLPLVLVKSASPVISMPCVARISMVPEAVVIGAVRIKRPPVVLRATSLSVVAVTAALTVKLPPAVTCTVSRSVLTKLLMVTALASNTVIAPLALIDKVSASMVLVAEPRVTAPNAADNTTLPALTIWPMVMLPVLEVMVTLPATPKRSVMTMLPSASIDTLPPSTTVMDETFKAPCCETVRLPLLVISTLRLSTLEVRLKLPPTVTDRFCAVTLPPSVTPPVAASCTVPPPVERPTLMSDTTTKLLARCVASPAPKLINSLTPGLVGKFTTVKLPVVFRPKLPASRSGMTNT
ncbi:hypothetical protein MCEMAEM4_03386 [Burkholderiaceae bacterium]